MWSKIHPAGLIVGEDELTRVQVDRETQIDKSFKTKGERMNSPMMMQVLQNSLLKPS